MELVDPLGEQEQYYAGSDSDVGSDTANVCYMVQGDNPLEVTTESELEEDVDESTPRGGVNRCTANLMN